VTAFVCGVFREAGSPVLPQFVKALTSPDRVVRSNAARACGLSGDRSTIPSLRKALDLESGLSRASIAWALGQLKAKEALPDLQRLYLDAVNDEASGRGPGFRHAQAVAHVQEQYRHLRDLDALRSDWEDLKSVTRPEPRDPRDHEPLLTPQRVLAAVRTIGAGHSQELCRVLVGAKDREARQTGAEGLGAAGAADRERNLTVLRGLAADDSWDVRVTAAVSLLRLGHAEARKTLGGWLADRALQALAVKRLGSVEDRERLAFAREHLERIADDEDIDANVRAEARALLKR
jgi:HEAT repeat protein